MGGGDHDGSVGAQEAVGVIGHGGGAEAQVDDLGALQGQAAGQGIEKRLGMRPHIATDDDLLAAEEGEDGAADLEGEVVREGFAVDAANVVCLENTGHDESPSPVRWSQHCSEPACEGKAKSL